MGEIVSELGYTNCITLPASDYVTNVDHNQAKRAIEAIGAIAVSLPAAGDLCINLLINFLTVEIAHVAAMSVVVLKDFVRKYPSAAEEVANKVLDYIREGRQPTPGNPKRKRLLPLWCG